MPSFASRLISGSAVFLLLWTTSLQAQQVSAPNVTSESRTSSTEVTVSKETGNVSLDFRDANIRNVLEVLALKSGINIVASPQVTGTVSIQLQDVPWKRALEVVLETYGYAYEQKGNVIVVTTIEDLKQRRENALVLSEQEPLVTEIFTLNFAKASQVVVTLDKMKTERGSIDFDERTNTVIVTDTRKQIESLAPVVEKLDQTTPQVLIEAKILETTLSDTENLGIEWTAGITAAGAEIPTTWPFHQTSSNSYTSDNFPGTDNTLGSANTEFSYGTLNFTQLRAVFEMLSSRTDTNILSNPRIMTLDNTPAQITVGTQYPIPQYTYNEEQARLQVSGWNYMDIGIIFNVTPHVSSAGYVSLDIEPRITAITDTTVVENTTLPILSNESAQTSVMIKDGETVVIAGLIKDQTTDTKRKLPFLGDIPILGKAFQKSSESQAKTDLMIFMTPHIVTPDIPKTN